VGKNQFPWIIRSDREELVGSILHDRLCRSDSRFEIGRLS